MHKNVTDLHTLFPGLKCIFSSTSHRIFAQPGSSVPEVIQVFGEAEIGGDHTSESPPYGSRVVATLHGDECKLYELLDWRKKIRSERDIELAMNLRNPMFFSGVAFVFFVSFFAVQNAHPRLAALSSVSFVVLDTILALLTAFTLVESPLMIVRWRKERKARKAIDVWLEDYTSREFNHEHMAQLLSALTSARSADFATEAAEALLRKILD